MEQYATLLMLPLLLVAFYFLFIRPQKKQEKKIQDMRNSIKVGDEITTIGGIIGKVVSIKDETLIIETGRDRTKIRILKSAIRSVDMTAEEVAAEQQQQQEAKES